MKNNTNIFTVDKAYTVPCTSICVYTKIQHRVVQPGIFYLKNQRYFHPPFNNYPSEPKGTKRVSQTSYHIRQMKYVEKYQLQPSFYFVLHISCCNLWDTIVVIISHLNCQIKINTHPEMNWVSQTNCLTCCKLMINQ